MKEFELPVLRPAAAYDLVAPHYDEWRWQNFWRRTELPVVESMLDLLPPIGLAGDIGTGTGTYLDSLRRRKIDSIGADLSQQMLLLARRRLGKSICLVQSDVVALAFATGVFDLLLCCRVLSHVRRLDSAIGELARVLRPGGTLIITDVSAQHDYTVTRIPVGSKVVRIETIKWADEDIIATAQASGLALREKRALTARNLSLLPDKDSYSSIDYSGVRPISYIMRFEKRRQTTI